MSISSVDSALAAYQYANKTQKNNAAEKNSFADTVKQTAEKNSASREEQYVEYLKRRYGANVMVKNIGNDQRSIDNFGASIAGYNNVAIAPNILEKMADDPKKAAYYEKIIQRGLDDIPRCKAAMSMNGFEMSSYAVSIDEKGVGYIYVTGDLKPEVRARIEAKVRAEQAAKRARRKRYRELAKEAAVKRTEHTEAARGLDYQPCGVVVYEDGNVTYIGGCADSPRRVAQVQAINKAKREKNAARRKASLERSGEEVQFIFGSD